MMWNWLGKAAGWAGKAFNWLQGARGGVDAAKSLVGAGWQNKDPLGQDRAQAHADYLKTAYPGVTPWEHATGGSGGSAGAGQSGAAGIQSARIAADAQLKSSSISALAQIGNTLAQDDPASGQHFANAIMRAAYGRDAPRLFAGTRFTEGPPPTGQEVSARRVGAEEDRTITDRLRQVDLGRFQRSQIEVARTDAQTRQLAQKAQERRFDVQSAVDEARAQIDRDLADLRRWLEPLGVTGRELAGIGEFVRREATRAIAGSVTMGDVLTAVAGLWAGGAVHREVIRRFGPRVANRIRQWAARKRRPGFGRSPANSRVRYVLCMFCLWLPSLWRCFCSPSR